MPFIEFTQPAEVRAGSDDGCKVLKSWKAGQVVELSSAACQYWLNRNMARSVQGKAKRPTPPPVAEAPKAEPEKKASEAVPEAKEAAPSSSAPLVPRSRRGRPRKSAAKPSSSS